MLLPHLITHHCSHPLWLLLLENPLHQSCLHFLNSHFPLLLFLFCHYNIHLLLSHSNHHYLYLLLLFHHYNYPTYNNYLLTSPHLLAVKIILYNNYHHTHTLLLHLLCHHYLYLLLLPILYYPTSSNYMLSLSLYPHHLCHSVSSLALLYNPSLSLSHLLSLQVYNNSPLALMMYPIYTCLLHCPLISHLLSIYAHLNSCLYHNKD